MAHDFNELLMREVTNVSILAAVHDERECLNRAGIRRTVQPLGQIGSTGHFSLPESGKSVRDFFGRNAKRHPAAGTAYVKPENQPWALRRTAVDARPQAQCAMIATQQRRPSFEKVKLGSPDK